MTDGARVGYGRTLAAAVGLLALRAALRPGAPRRVRSGAGLEATEARPSAALVVVVAAAVLFVAGAVGSVVLATGGFIGGRWWLPPGPEAARTVAGGDAERGRSAILAYGCRACHAVPGLPRLARRGVGPPLDGVSGRAYIGGVLPNRPEMMVAWIMDPPRHASRTAMPDMGIDRATARDIAAYLYTR